MNSGLFLLFSMGILGGIISALLLKKARAPQVVGYILAGLFIGQSGLQLVSLQDIQKLETFNYFALGLVGFLVGGEIKIADLRRYGKQFSAILFAEGLGAFAFVSLLTGLVLYKVTGSWNESIAGGLIFGALSSATDPASTISVLWENKTAGILTTTLIAIIALDDALAMFLYGICSGISQIIAGGGGASFSHELSTIAIELPGSLVVGTLLGLLNSQLLLKYYRNEQILTASFGIFLLAIALSLQTGFDVILVTMTIGFIVANRTPVRSKTFMDYMKGLSNPVYVLFFVLIGSRLAIKSMPLWLWVIVAVYVFGRSAGKISGAFLGAKISKADPLVQKYTGLGLFCQGGVAIGLSIMAAHYFDVIKIADGFSLGDVIITAVATTTFLIQLIGPPLVKIAMLKSGETGRDITIDDLLQKHKVGDMLSQDSISVLREKTTVSEAIDYFSESNSPFLPVVAENNVLCGVVTFDDLRQMLAEPDLWSWSLVTDIVNFNFAKVSPTQNLGSAVQLAHTINHSHIIVAEKDKFVSVLNVQEAEKKLKNELLNKRGAQSTEKQNQ